MADRSAIPGKSRSILTTNTFLYFLSLFLILVIRPRPWVPWPSMQRDSLGKEQGKRHNQGLWWLWQGSKCHRWRRCNLVSRWIDWYYLYIGANDWLHPLLVKSVLHFLQVEEQIVKRRSAGDTVPVIRIRRLSQHLSFQYHSEEFPILDGPSHLLFKCEHPRCPDFQQIRPQYWWPRYRFIIRCGC